MRRKTRILLTSYLTVAIIALALYTWAGQWGLGWYRRAANESASLAFEETVRSVQTLSSVLEKSVYATDSGMCDRICSEAYACAAAAESAMSTLPFSTWELERLSAFLNTAGDYAYSLCGVGEGFTQEQRETLQKLSVAASDFSDTLLSLRDSLNSRDLRMDSREKRLRNIGTEETPPLSRELLSYEADFTPLSLHYDGQYGGEEKPVRNGLLTEQEMLRAAASFAGVPEEEVRLEYRYEGSEDRRCYRTDDRFLCVSRSGVESMSQNRLVSTQKLSMEQAQEKAEALLAAQGYGSLTLLNAVQNSCVAQFRYVRTQGEAICPENGVSIAIALDDGSVFSFDARDYSAEQAEVTWALDADTAAAALPEGLTVLESRPVILQSPGGLAVPCYAFSCQDPEGKAVEICVSAETGRQYRITVGKA